MRTLVSIGTFAAGLACGFGNAFVCEDDAECNVGGELGLCQSGGYCSFPDDTCDSGQRYGEHAGGGLAGECVPSSLDTEGSEGGTMTVSTSAGDDGPDDATVSDSASSASASTSGSVDTDTSTGPVGVDDSTGDGGESTEGPVELDPDLVLWLTFDDPDAPLLDSSMYEREVSCDEATDACPVGVAGAMDLAAQFDGTNDLLQVVHDPALETDQGLTVAVRVRNDALTTLTIHTVIARPYGVATENAWELFFRDETGDGASDVVFEIADPGGQLQVLATPAVAKGEWMRIVAVWDVDTASLYFDGALQSSVATTGMLLDESPVAIGGDFDDLLPANWFVGAIDDVRVYRRALTGDEIAALP